MTQYNTLNVKLSNSQLNKLKPGTKHSTEYTLNLSSNVIDDSNDEINFPQNYHTQVSRIHKAFGNGSSFSIKLVKLQLSEMVQSGGYGRLGLLGTLPPVKMANSIADSYEK